MYIGQENPLERTMIAFIHKLSITLLMAAILASSPLCGAFSACQKLGEYCGNPPTETFPACCPFDTNATGGQVPLKCKNLDNGVGTCETVEDTAKDTEQSK